ncbi:MaoC family dehydratase [Gemmatimonas groenlandica]|uniref:MaoC family dehydratase n=1 Tax=Gemmatimonas groenlandica TaxID=2732249 RepID=A0A6M4IMA8_9BACT|nr:MaoC family dehydratase [Gemmatimonas groenlandica]QJR35205.1 MaoC family dehydratase [Gemmatimonas groenlandica]
MIGNFFEDFFVGQVLVHATPRTVTEGDVAMYTALYGGRFAVHSSTPFAQALGFACAPVDSMLVFHIVFGKTVPDISLNAIANLGYADGRFGVPVYPGDTLSTISRVTGIKLNRDGTTGVVYVHSVGRNQRDEIVVEYARWVMVRKRDGTSAAPETVVPDLPTFVAPASLHVPVSFAVGAYNTQLGGSAYLWDDYHVGERIDHVDGITIEEADHMLAARLFQNTARVHFNQHVEREGRFGRRIVYGGHVISLSRALSFNGLANTIGIAAIHGGRHTNPTFAGDTIYAWSEILAADAVRDRTDVGALRIRTVALKDRSASDFTYRDATEAYDPSVVLDFDYTILMPRR